jgi:hypothetical protein
MRGDESGARELLYNGQQAQRRASGIVPLAGAPTDQIERRGGLEQRIARHRLAEQRGEFVETQSVARKLDARQRADQRRREHASVEQHAPAVARCRLVREPRSTQPDSSAERPRVALHDAVPRRSTGRSNWAALTSQRAVQAGKLRVDDLRRLS